MNIIKKIDFDDIIKETGIKLKENGIYFNIVELVEITRKITLDSTKKGELLFKIDLRILSKNFNKNKYDEIKNILENEPYKLIYKKFAKSLFIETLNIKNFFFLRKSFLEQIPIKKWDENYTIAILILNILKKYTENTTILTPLKNGPQVGRQNEEYINTMYITIKELYYGLINEKNFENIIYDFFGNNLTFEEFINFENKQKYKNFLCILATISIEHESIICLPSSNFINLDFMEWYYYNFCDENATLKKKKKKNFFTKI